MISIRAFALTALTVICLVAIVPASAQQTLYATNYNGSTIKKFTSNGTGTDFASARNAFGLAFDSAGNLYAGNYYGNLIQKYTPGGVGSTFAVTGLNNARDLVFDRAGNLYAANLGAFDTATGTYSNPTIEKFTPDGVGSVFASTGLNNPYGLAFDGAGNLYVANAGSNTIEKFTPGGLGSVFATTGISQPTGLAFDSVGNLYVASSNLASIGPTDVNGNTIQKFTPDGIGSVFANTGSNRHYDLAFDSAGNLYAANYTNGAIEKFDMSTGASSIFASTGQSGLYGLVFTPAPEPPSLVALALGVSGLSILAFKAKRRPA